MSDGLSVRVNQALTYFKSQGWSHNQAAGIVANLQAESQVDPSAAQHGGGPGYGLAQWEHDRQRTFKQWSGHDIHGTSLQEQMAFVQYELSHTEQAAGQALKHITTAGEAGASVCRLYERPADINGQAAYRCALAEKIAKTYGQFANVIAGSSTTAPKAPTGS